MMRISSLAAVVLLAACAPSAPLSGGGATADMSTKVAEAQKLALSPRGAAAELDRNRAACVRLGGSYEPAGRAGYLNCILAYPDAGKSCTDGADCQGDCRAEAGATSGPGTCQANTSSFGCYSKVEQGKAVGAICVD